MRNMRKGLRHYCSEVDLEKNIFLCDLLCSVTQEKKIKTNRYTDKFTLVIRGVWNHFSPHPKVRNGVIKAINQHGKDDFYNA